MGPYQMPPTTKPIIAATKIVSQFSSSTPIDLPLASSPEATAQSQNP
jgi:hypothetical protein